MDNNPTVGQGDWKNKYLNALDEQDRRERQQQYMLNLLIKGMLRISLVAEGIDPQLDKQLAGLRQLLREGSPSRRDLTTLVDALAGQVKRLDIIKTERAKALTLAFKSLVSQLQRLKPEQQTARQLTQLNKQLKTPSSVVQQSSAMLNDYANLQQRVLDEHNIKQISKPFWHQWVVAEIQPLENNEASNEDQQKTELRELHQVEPNKQNFELASDGFEQPLDTEEAIIDKIDPGPTNVGLSTLIEAVDEQPVEHGNVEDIGEEPPFSRLNQAICTVLSDLLAQIEPPPTAQQNYQTAKKLINKGLNWYELIPTLEEISIVVVSAFDNHHKDFEGFLTGLNERLVEAYAFIQASGQVQKDSFIAGQQLQNDMREQLSAMQQGVNEATELEQLKSEVNLRLDTIVSAMDQHQSGEEQRQSSLSEQLDTLAAQVKTLEAAAEQAEHRIEEQRQKALRDVLTQLPNREAYQQRLQQESERWQRYQRPLTMAVCDIDYFKRINDGYGHLAGDKVLRIIAKTLSMRLRKTDFIARYGGEEFVIIMPETEPDAAYNVLEGLREAIASCPFHFKEKPVSITLSFGVSGFKEGDTGETVFARCDKALYQAKEQGRNQTVSGS